MRAAGIFVVFLALLWAGAGVAGGDSRPVSVIKVGVSIPFTGPQGYLGEGVRNSILLASELFDKRQRVKFLFEDDGFLPRNTLSAVSKFITADRVQALIVYGSSNALAVSDLVERERVPLVAMATAQQLVVGRQYIVRHWLSGQRETELIVREVQRRGYRRIAVATAIQDGTLQLRDLFLARVAAAVVYNQEFDSNEQDFRSVAADIKASAPDAVYFLLFTPQAALLAKQLRHSGFQVEFFAAHQLEDANVIPLSDGAVVGMWYVNADTRFAGDFYKKYRQRYGIDATNYTPNAFDIARIMIQGSEAGDINRYMHEVQDFSGACGRYSANGRNEFDLPVALRRISSSGFEDLDSP